MAIGHIAVRAHSRANGHSAAAAVAYRFGLALTCSRTGERHDFSRRSQRADVAACGLTPGPFRTAAELANAIEDAERRKNSRLLRDVQIALPTELDEDARAALAERFAGELAARYATATAWAVHRPDRRSDARNHHAHIVLPTRTLDAHGKFGKKIRSLDDRKRGPEEIEAIRALWEARANEALRAAGLDARVHTGRTTDPEPTLGPTHTAIERRAWSKRHHGQTPPAMSAAQLVLDDGRCATGRGRRLARHGERRALIDHTFGRHISRSVPVREDEPASETAIVTALESVPDVQPVPEPQPEPLTLPRALVAALEPVPDVHPDPEPRPLPLTLPRAPVTALEPVPGVHPDPEPRPAPLRLTETLDAVLRWTGVRARRMLDTAIRLARTERTRMMRPLDEIARARRRRTPAVQAHADNHGRAPTAEEIRIAEAYLAGGPNAAGTRPGLSAVIDRIATTRLDGSTRADADPFTRQFRIRRELEPHTRERPREENEYRLDRENLGPCRSPRGAEAAARMLAQALDEHQTDSYGTDAQGAPAPPPSIDDPRCGAWSQAGRERKRRRFIEASLERWRRSLAPSLLARIRQAIIPHEVQHRRELQHERQAAKAAADARRRQMATVPSRSVKPSPPTPVTVPSAAQEARADAYAAVTRRLTPDVLEYAGAVLIAQGDAESAREPLSVALQVDRHTRAHVLHELDAHTRRFRLRAVLGAVERTLADWRAWWRDGDRGRRIAEEIRARVWPTHWLETRLWLDDTDPDEQERIRRALDDQTKRRQREAEAHEAQRQQAARAAPRPRGLQR